MGNYLGEQGVAAAGQVTTEHPAFAEVEADAGTDRQAHVDQRRESPRSFHKRLGHIIWEKCGMARSKEGLEEAIRDVQALCKKFWENVKVVGSAEGINPELERAGRLPTSWSLES